MANLTNTTVTGVNGPVTATRNALTTSQDTLTVTKGILELYNTTGSSVTVTIDGSTATTISPSGYGGTVDISAGKAITVGANATVYVDLSTISAFLSGTIAISASATGVNAHVYI